MFINNEKITKENEMIVWVEHRRLPQQEPSSNTMKQILSWDEKNAHLAAQKIIKCQLLF